MLLQQMDAKNSASPSFQFPVSSSQISSIKHLAIWPMVTLLGFVAISHAASPNRIAYKVRIDGVKSRMLRTALERQSQTVRNRKRLPTSMRQLRHRARGDVPRLEAVLHARGFHEGQVETTVQTDKDKVQVHFKVTTGPQYQIGRWVVTYIEIPDANHPPPPLVVGAMQGQAAQIGTILQKEQDLLTQLRNEGYPFCHLGPREVALERQAQLVHLNTQIAPGPKTSFGSLEIRGLTGVKPVYVKGRVRWQTGDTFQERRLHDLEKDLLDCGLFSSATVQAGETLDPNGTVPIEVIVSERKHRTLRVGGTYVSDEQGLGGQLSWEHRNLGGRAQRLRSEVAISQTEWRQTNTYIQPDFLRHNWDLLLDLEIRRQYPEAYWSETIRSAASLQYRFTRQSRVWAGIAQDATRVEQFGIHNRYRFLEFPLGLDLDQRNDPLDAVRGWRYLIQVTPYDDARSDLSFYKTYTEGRIYRNILPRIHTVFAARVGAGLISGATLGEIPADKRFYAGGAGSVRGYAYQSIGPDRGGTSLGGLSLLETSLELRTKISPRVGTALFLDGGLVMSDRFRRGKEEPMRWGAGIGLRYSLGFAPLRFDIAFPINGADDDRKVQFYVSLGQAF